MTPLRRAGSGLLCALLLLPSHRAAAQWQGTVALQALIFDESDQDRRGSGRQPLVMANAGRRMRWQSGLGTHVLAASASVRLGLANGKETLLDVDDLHWQLMTDRWDLRLGVAEMSWGVLESVRLVDVINQRAPDVGASGGVKLGQPLANVAAKGGWGTLELYLLPWFRRRPLGGRAARLWTSRPVDAEPSVFGLGAGGWSPSWAVRWSRITGDWDVGVGVFDGTSREPAFVPAPGRAAPALVPRYDRVRQIAVDVQWTRGAWLWKLEALSRHPPAGRYAAVGGGLEHTPTDYLSLFVEYLHDSRGAEATTSFEHDVMIGARLLYPDGRLGLLGSADAASGNLALWLEVTRRLSNALMLTFDAGTFLGDASREPPLAQRLETFLAVGARRFF